MIKGDNVIEHYCALCKEPITLADVTNGWAREYEGKMVHTYHIPEVKNMMEDPKYIKVVEEINVGISLELGNEYIQETLSRFKVTVDELIPIFMGIVSKLRVENRIEDRRNKNKVLY